MKHKHGFSLIELAIVLVIIGLIVGGVVVGRAMLRNSELQAVVTESAKFNQATHAFLDKYKALPGDFATATSIWGGADADATTCKTTVSTDGIMTCNGDGNGRVSTFGTTTTYYEQYRAWQHLANAGFIDGNYTGVIDADIHANWGYEIGESLPASRMNGAGWKMLTITSYDISTIANTRLNYNNGDMPPNLLLWLGGAYFEAGVRMSGVLAPAEAFVFDSKVDDGKPFTGKWITQRSTGLTLSCDDGATDYATTDDSNLACVMIFKTGL